MTWPWVYFGNKNKFFFQIFLENQRSMARCVSRSCLLELRVGLISEKKKQVPFDGFLFCPVGTCFGDIWVINTSQLRLAETMHSWKKLSRFPFSSFFQQRYIQFRVLSKCNNTAPNMCLCISNPKAPKHWKITQFFPNCLRGHTTCSS